MIYLTDLKEGIIDKKVTAEVAHIAMEHAAQGKCELKVYRLTDYDEQVTDDIRIEVLRWY